MSTIIYPSPIYGPVHSRRLGISLGINLMPPSILEAKAEVARIPFVAVGAAAFLAVLVSALSVFLSVKFDTKNR